MRRPERIGHAVIKVRDPERSTKFYTEVVALQVTKLEPEIKMGFFASNRRDHTHRKVLSDSGGRAADKWRTVFESTERRTFSIKLLTVGDRARFVSGRSSFVEVFQWLRLDCSRRCIRRER
jgi:catechol 2,3-dioxygenase-like lactoylglutathione lyase family enzyme